MQGTWMKYGQQPTAFLQSWQNMYTLVKSVAPETVIVWAPNTPQGYPYGQTGTAFTSLSSVDQALLDTNQNGVLDAGDDSLAPYYPGDDLVDWIGLSICAFPFRNLHPRWRGQADLVANRRLQGYPVRYSEYRPAEQLLLGRHHGYRPRDWQRDHRVVPDVLRQQALESVHGEEVTLWF